ncbi:hypothetical protein TA3x_000398 [Tundrisphaera sp. TA3]|uniref:hypothetical protein n=1 Tax=Tundrisphaera sp. TA3 TaxID=3435775 RepID=UPI003EC10419
MTPYELDATIARLQSESRFWCDGATKPTGNAIRDLLIDAMVVIDALQAENARLMQAHMEGGIRAGELTAKLLDAERCIANKKHEKR